MPVFNQQGFMASVAQHGEIVAAIEVGDASAVCAVMKRHLDAAERALIDEMGRART